MKNKYSIVIILLLLNIISCTNTNVTEPEEKVLTPTIKATSNGDSWELFSSLPTLIGVSSIRLTDIASNDNNIYVATSGGGVYKINTVDSTINRLTDGLIPIPLGSYNNYYVGAILFNNNRIIVGSTNLTNKGGILVKENDNPFQNKIIWNKYNVVVSLYRSPNGEIFAGCFEEFWKSTDNGNTWLDLIPYTENSFGYFYSFTFDKNGNIYSTTSHGVYYSDSRIMEFKIIGLNNESTRGIDINSKGWIYVTTGNGKMYYSKDSGLKWEQLPNYPNLSGYCLYINKNDYIIVGTGDGIYRSKDLGATWEFVGLKNELVLRIIGDSKGGLIAGTYMNRIYYSKM